MFLVVEAHSTQIVIHGSYDDSAFGEKVLSYLGQDLLFEVDELRHFLKLFIDQLDVSLKLFN